MQKIERLFIPTSRKTIQNNISLINPQKPDIQSKIQ